MVETTAALVVLCLVFFGLFQIFHYATARLFCSYASFYGAKAQSLGYAKRTIDKAVRVAAVGISGEDRSSPPLFKGDLSLLERMRLYMATGNSGLDFSYWDPQGRDAPELRVSIPSYGRPGASAMAEATVTLYKALMLDENLANFFQIATHAASPSATSVRRNYAQDFLKP